MKKVKQKLRRTREYWAKKRRMYLKARPHRSFRVSKKPRTPRPIASIKQTVLSTFQTIWQEKKILGGLALIYAALTYVFVGGVAQADFLALQDATLQVVGGSFTSLNTVVSLLTSTMSGAFNSELSELQQFLGIFIAVLFWLALVWALRLRFAEQPIKIRDALYNSGAPILAYAAIAFIIIMQLTPGAVGFFVLNTALNGGWLQGGIEIMAFTVAAILLGCLSVYWLAGSLLSLIIVTLPQMYPWRALQMASELVIGRRLRIVAHMAVLVVVLVVAWAIALLPTLLLVSWLRLDWFALVPVMVQLLGALTLVYVATYVYKLYRSML